MSFKVKDKIALNSDIPNKAQIPILNHRDDGEMKSVKMDGETCKVFSFRTLNELQLSHHFVDCEVAIAEDFFWTAMPFIVDGRLPIATEEEHDAFHSCVVASVWGTPCVITPDGDAYACYEVIPKDDFPGVYLKDWSPEFLANQIDKATEFLQEVIDEMKDGDVL